ncbi:NADPH-dependent F420 reductase [Nocardioides immobilis]|uniref:NADPH-dependent F420 reductase n=1 Tax=Nocardioides immobilis TaxID=2049295 RepID=A0A417Y8Q2_9ACTN|nr:NADPH-dependent F420 reductase [Nocardioides immobilis]RHW29140.1 NADPH-dependent F420 reductase [Nocardioides immobilis]
MALQTIAVIGGTGPQGKGLGLRFAQHGHHVLLGSRSPDRAEAAAAEINAKSPAAPRAQGGTNSDVAAAADLVLLAIPFAGHDEIVGCLTKALAGKIVISCVNPLAFDRSGPYALGVDHGSAAEAAAVLAPESQVVGAFHHVSASALWSDRPSLHHEDVLVCGDHEEAKSVVQELARSVTGRRGIDAGPLRMARQLEPWTAVLISINKRYKTQSGVRISGIDGSH